ncbi:hypothetical protein MRX96_000973 [Rhipicephalus microplus]
MQPRSSKETYAAFEKYFDTGMTSSEAIRHHQEQLSARSDGIAALANGLINPNARSVYRWHQSWRENKYGPPGNPIPKREANKDLYQARGIAVHTSVEDDFWAVLVITPIMRRAQQLESARDIIFVDSTASCDETKSNVTVLLTAIKAGAVPTGVLVHSSQSGYEVAFRLLKDHSPKCFENAQAPQVFMTDNSRSEKEALHSVWPSAH